MVQLFKKMFRQKELQQAEHPPSQQQYDEDYIIYCIEQEQAIDKLESALHTSDNPEEIAIQTLKTACGFYGADWAGIIELDLELGLTTTGWWYNADHSVTKLNRMNEFENLYPMQTWLDSIKNGNPIIIEDVAKIAKTPPQEYPVYKRLDVQSLLAVPFGPNPLGFLVLRNPSKYIRLASTLNTLAYIMHRAMAQRDTLNRRSMALALEEIKTDKDIVINFFGNIEIYTKIGVWKEQDFHWVVGIATEYKMKYIGMVNELLSILAQFSDYGGIQHYANKALALVPENVKGQYWLIYAMYHDGTIALTRQELQQAKLRLTDDEFASLVGLIRKDCSIQNEQILGEKSSI